MVKRMVFMLTAVGLVFGGIFGFHIFKGHMIRQAIARLRNPPQTVSAITAASQEWSRNIHTVGTLHAVRGANISSQIAGIVSAIHFQSGLDVKKGDLLVQLKAAEDIAKLDALKATAELARITYERHKKLLARQAVPQQQVVSDAWTLKNNEALVAQQEALIGYKSIKAPFSGRLGIRQVDLGQYIPAGTPIVTLQQLNPIYVDFYVPQQALAKIKVGQPVSAKIDTYPHRIFSGKISAINSLVDTATRNIKVQATISNPNDELLPGMFARVEVDTGTPKSYVTLPQTAIAYNSYGDIAYVIERKGKNGEGKPRLIARQTFVTTGATRGDQVAVLSGVNAGDLVVTAGQMKLRNGTPILINNFVQPADSPNPKLADR